MGNSKNITILFILSTIGCTIYSQSSSNFSQFFLQDYSYNSSLIGTDDNSLNVNLIHRQWGTVNYDSSPYSEYLGFEKSIIKKNTKLGFSGQYIHDFEGQAFTTNKFNVGVSVNQKLFSNLYGGMGLSLNYSNRSFNPLELENMESGDQALLNGQQPLNMLAPAFGLNLKYDNSKNFMFQLGASSTNTTNLLNNYSKSILKYISDEFNISLKTKFGSLSGLNGEFQALYRGNGGFDNYTGWTNTRSPRSISGVFLVHNIPKIKLSTGASFNGFFLENDRLQNLSISPIVLFPIKIFTIGVSYDIGLTNFKTYNNGIAEVSISYNLNIKSSRSSNNFKVGNIRIKTGDNSFNTITLQNNQSVSPINLIGQNFDKEINGFDIKFKLFDSKKKMPKEICYNVKTYSIKDGIEITGEILRQNQQVTIRKGSDDYSNWITFKLEKGSDEERYIVEVYNCNNPKERFSIKLKRDWR